MNLLQVSQKPLPDAAVKTESKSTSDVYTNEDFDDELNDKLPVNANTDASSEEELDFKFLKESSEDVPKQKKKQKKLSSSKDNQKLIMEEQVSAELVFDYISVFLFLLRLDYVEILDPFKAKFFHRNYYKFR